MFIAAQFKLFIVLNQLCLLRREVNKKFDSVSMRHILDIKMEFSGKQLNTRNWGLEERLYI